MYSLILGMLLYRSLAATPTASNAMIAMSSAVYVKVLDVRVLCNYSGLDPQTSMYMSLLVTRFTVTPVEP
jgi:hypothetical protein